MPMLSALNSGIKIGSNSRVVLLYREFDGIDLEFDLTLSSYGNSYMAQPISRYGPDRLSSFDRCFSCGTLFPGSTIKATCALAEI